MNIITLAIAFGFLALAAMMGTLAVVDEDLFQGSIAFIYLLISLYTFDKSTRGDENDTQDQ